MKQAERYAYREYSDSDVGYTCQQAGEDRHGICLAENHGETLLKTATAPSGA